MVRAQPARGFTLVELLIALFAMSLLAVLSWRGLDGMARAQEQTETRADQMLTLQVGLAQWAADLDAMIQLQGEQALNWDGQVLRLTRRSSANAADGVVVAAWTQRMVNNTSMWLRWQSPPVTTHGDLAQAWARAELWARNPGADERAREVAVTPLDDWQLFYFRGNAWTNPQSSGSQGAAPTPSGAASAPAATSTVGQPLPEGIRLVLELPAGQAMNGALTIDWARKTRP
jgi:general secretion pathway protein J